jgi:hypothetical protein
MQIRSVSPDYGIQTRAESKKWQGCKKFLLGSL